MESTTNRKGALSIIAGIGLILLAIVLFIQNGTDDAYLLAALTAAYGIFLIVQRKGLVFSVASFAYSGVILGHYAYRIANSIYQHDYWISELSSRRVAYGDLYETTLAIVYWEKVTAEYKFLLVIGVISFVALLLLQALRYAGNTHLADTIATFVWFIPSILYGIYLVWLLVRYPDVEEAVIIAFQIVIFFLLGLWLKGTRSRATTNTANPAEE